jgi:endoglucanase
MSKRGLRGALAAAALLAATAHAEDRSCAAWPDWQAFKRLYVSRDGRVVDASMPQALTVSEGQSYAMTFALVADDQPAFASLLGWTRDNLAAGDLARTLPAWKWGRAEDGRWGVLDRNSAADADLWMAYTLGAAGRLWHDPAYSALSQAMQKLVLRDEVVLVPGLGATLLPGPRGFVTQETWRLSASYSPPELLRSLARYGDASLWAGVLDSSSRVIVASAPRGYASDWIVYRPGQGFGADPATHGVGSYNAIRVYLWAGMLAEDDPQAAQLRRLLEPMAAAAVRHALPESIDTNTLETHGEAPVGFLAALLPLLVQLKTTDAIESYRKRIEAGSLKDNQHYYSDALTLFGLGWLENRFRFDRHGDLRVRWSGACRAD